MPLTLNTSSNPGSAEWSVGSAVVAAGSFTALFATQGLVKTITVPPGLENAPIIISYGGDPFAYGISGGSTYSSISGTTLTITFYDQYPLVDGLPVSWAVFSVPLA